MTAVHDTVADMVIVGAGPAGLAAIDTLGGQSLKIHVIDEQHRAGGQIYRQPPATFKVSDWMEGPLYKEGKALLRDVESRTDINWHFGTTVLGLFDADNTVKQVWLNGPDGAYTLKTRAVLIAPGCYDLPVAFPGWTLPGVMSAGGVQAFVKSQQIVPGNRFLFAGAHPLQLIVADQVLTAGGDVAAVVFSQSFREVFKALKHMSVLWRHQLKFRETAKVLGRLRKAGIPVLFNHSILNAEGQDAVTGARVVPIGEDGVIDSARARTFDCDRVAICYGFLPNSELARQAGAHAEWDRQAGGWIIPHDRDMCSSVPDIYVAGEITGVAGAEVAAEEGRLAALGYLSRMGKNTSDSAIIQRRDSESRLKSLRGFADLLRQLSHVPQSLLDQLLSADTLICRCEGRTVADLESDLAPSPHFNTADGFKLASRFGMGLCQGRFCSHRVTQKLALQSGLDENKVGGFSTRVPVKPVLIGDLLPK